MPKRPSEEAVIRPRSSKRRRLRKLIEMLKTVPEEWIQDKIHEGDDIIKLLPLPCQSYDVLLGHWKKALKWRRDLDVVLSIMLSVVVSTIQQGDQLFVMVVGSASGGKTTFCDALLVSEHCYALEHLTGFFSGAKDADGNDFSLINRVNRKVMITPEGDTLLSNPKFGEIMSQQRRIFDGKSQASYKNSTEDKTYSGLRTPWIIAGTHTLLESDQSRLGDRFLKVFLHSPTDVQRKEIQAKSALAALAAVQTPSEGEELVNEAMQTAYQYTAGYVNYLRENATSLINTVKMDHHWLSVCESLGEYTSFMRSRPGKAETSFVTKEEPFRLTKQMVRLMVCVAATMNKTNVDLEVAKRVRQVAYDTSHGPVRDIHLCLMKEGSASAKTLAILLDKSNNFILEHLKFMRQIGMVELLTDRKAKSQRNVWRVTTDLKKIHLKVTKISPPPKEPEEQ